jgi:predicted dehydrogenase
MLAEVNSHDWDTVRWLMGAEIARVYAETANLKGPALQVDTPGYYDNALVNLRFSSGSLGMISGICPCSYGYDARVEIYGDKGIMLIGELQGGVRYAPGSADAHLPHLARTFCLGVYPRDGTFSGVHSRRNSAQGERRRWSLGSRRRTGSHSLFPAGKTGAAGRNPVRGRWCMNLPKTMQAAVYHGAQDLRVEPVPVPEPAAGELVVRVLSASICGTDCAFTMVAQSTV